MKYPKTDFSGDPVEKARLIGFIEDCSASYHHRQISVRTSTTHRAQLGLFNEHFGKYGHVNETSGYNRQLNLYHWNVYVYLNPTFDFLPEYKKNPVKFLSENTEDDCEIVRIASFTDAEGWVGIESNKGRSAVILYISNSSRQLLELTQRTIGGNINQDHGGYKLVLRGDEAVEVIRELPIRHEEKVAAKELILRHYNNRGIRIEALKEYRELRRKIDEEVRLCTMQARLEWIVRHDKPHRDDPDQQYQRCSPSLPLFSLFSRFSDGLFVSKVAPRTLYSVSRQRCVFLNASLSLLVPYRRAHYRNSTVVCRGWDFQQLLAAFEPRMAYASGFLRT